jgi:hypothetical protein
MHILRVSLASVAFLSLQAVAQIGEYDPIYNDYDYCQGITSDSKTYKPIVRLTVFKFHEGDIPLPLIANLLT